MTISRQSLAILVAGSAAFILSDVQQSSWGAFLHSAFWCLAQWLPISSLKTIFQDSAWKYWEESLKTQQWQPQAIPTVDVQQHIDDLSSYLEATYGKDWRSRPLLLKGLWNSTLNNPNRHLSMKGLLQEKLTIPYFTDSRLKDALSPDSHGRVQDIVHNISLGMPHKIGTQLLVQTYPDLIHEVAPTEIVTHLFGDYFQPEHVKGMGPYHAFPGLTTVPVFIASGRVAADERGENVASQAYTGLHCEPIGNVAVQLSGQKRWTMVRPEFSFLIKPKLAPDGRAFFASDGDYSSVPFYDVITKAGDAIWVPTWTWHRVDYIDSHDMAIGGSLFHFRFFDYVINNPLFALLIVPAIFLELVGYKTQ